MIYQRPRFYIVCDECGLTIETNAAEEKIAAETAKRQGWECIKLRTYLDGTTKYLNLCPKCKEK